MEQFEIIYEKYYKKLYLFLLRLSGDKNLAEELTQETLYAAFLHMEQYEGRSTIFTWLCQIAKNNWLKEVSRNNRLQKTDKLKEQDSGYNLEKEVEKNQMLSIMRKEMMQLPEPYVSVCALRIYAELSYAEIAAEFNKSESWAKVTFFRGKTMLTERMEKYR